MPEKPNIDTLYAVATNRKLFNQPDLEAYEKHKVMGDARAAVDVSQANLISSEVSRGKHMPVIDCDFGVQAIPSSTPGHYHLYLDQELTWDQYKALLDGFHKAGLIQDGWYDNAMSDERSYVRLPHIKKSPAKPVNPEEEKQVVDMFHIQF